MPLVSPKIPLMLSVACASVFALVMLLSPQAFLAQYALDVSGMPFNDRMAIIENIQLYGIQVITAVAIQSVAIHVGTETTQMHLCSMGVVWELIALPRFYLSIDTWVEEYGVSRAGMYMNLCLLCVCLALFGLGAGLSVKLPEISHMLYWGPIGMAVVYLAFGIGVTFCIDSMLSSYGDNAAFQQKTLDFLKLLLSYVAAPAFLQNGLLLVGTLLSTDTLYAYVLNRTLFGVYCMGFMQAATNLAWMQGQDDPDLDGIADGQRFNALLGVVFLMLLYVPLARMDSPLAGSVEKAVRGPQSLLCGQNPPAPSGRDVGS